MPDPTFNDPQQDGTNSRAGMKVKALWQLGDLFHATSRYPRRAGVPRHDRLAGILKNGLVAPSRCQDASVRSDLHIVFTDAPVPYDSLVFLHRFGPQSSIYTLCEPGRFAVFVDPDTPVLTPEEMGSEWPELCQDEVYVRDHVPPARLIGIAVHPADADSVAGQFRAEFRRLQIPLYDYSGSLLWPAPHR